MAILKAPLLSLGAAQQLGKSLVFFPWKGLNVVREYVVPSNPKTTLQVTQRGYVTAAVDAIHDAQAHATHPLGAADVTAYGLLASTRAKPRTWFNEAIKNWVDVNVASKLGCVVSDGSLDDSTPAQLDAECYLSESTCAAGTFFYGTSKTALINSVAASITSQVATATISPTVAGTKYYVQFRADAADPCEGARSGIYSKIST